MVKVIKFIDAEEALKSGINPFDIVDNDIIKTRIYGGFFINGLQKQALCKQRETLILRTDTKNEKDCFAIKVMNSKNENLGYIKKDLAQAIVSISDWECKVFEPYDELAMMGNTKNMFGISILLYKKK